MDESYNYIRRLYLERLTGNISHEEDRELTELLCLDIEAQHIWEDLEKERRDLNADIILGRIDPSEELQELKERFEENTDPIPLRRRRLWWGVAAAAILFTVGLSYLFWGKDRSTDRQQGSVATTVGESTTSESEGIQLVLADGKSIAFSENGSEEYVVGGLQLKNTGSQLKYTGDDAQAAALHTLKVPATKDYSIVLSDGTHVFLNSESTLRFPFQFSGETREIFIEGEAYFEVAKDAKRPFIVHTPVNDIQVMGTRFNVNTYQEGVVRTSLVEGSVLLTNADRKPLELFPGQEAAYSQARGIATSNFDPAEVLAWREGVFYFHNLPLESLSAILSRWFNVDLTFERDRLRQHQVSGMLEKGHLDEFLQDLNRTSGVKSNLSGGTLTLK